MKLVEAFDADILYQNHFTSLVKLAGFFITGARADNWVQQQQKRFKKFAKKRWRTELDANSYFATERTLYFFLSLQLLKHEKLKKWGGLFWNGKHQQAFMEQLEAAIIAAELHQQVKIELYEPNLSHHTGDQISS